MLLRASSIGVSLITRSSPSSGSTLLSLAGDPADVRAMYESYPYPSPVVSDALIYDLATGFHFLFVDDQLEGKRVLDVGCGSGHRLIGTAKRYPKAEFTGVDMTMASLDTARQLAEKNEVGNVQLMHADLLELNFPEPFDIVISTGVIHHLAAPAVGLKSVFSQLSHDGVFIGWFYHALGEHQRLVDRELYLTLAGGVGKPIEEGLKLLKELELSLPASQYGVNSAQAEGAVSQANLDVDAYMHPIVHAYRFDEIVELFQATDADWTAINGINMLNESKLLDLSEVDESRLRFANLKVEDIFSSPVLAELFKSLSPREKLRAIELKLKPNGFTIVAGREDSYRKLAPRIAGSLN